MQIAQVKELLEAFHAFAGSVCKPENNDLILLASLFSSGNKETIGKFVERIKKRWAEEKGEAAFPPLLKAQLEQMAGALQASAAPKAKEAVSHILTLFEGVEDANSNAFIERIVSARDYVRPSKPKKSNSGGTTRIDLTVTSYVESFRTNALKTNEFTVALRRLQGDSKISDARVKKIAKVLSGRTSKTRDDAIANILEFQNKEALSQSTRSAHQLLPV